MNGAPALAQRAIGTAPHARGSALDYPASAVTPSNILVLGSTGKTGRRVVDRLAARNVHVRAGSRAGDPPFDWEQRATWAAALRNVESVYITYSPDVAVPGAVDTIREFTELAVNSSVEKLVFLSGRGEDEALRAETVVQNAGVDWTILRCTWFAQNFSENFLQEAILRGEVVLPAGNVGEPFVDADDIADVAVAALTENGHTGEIYELTGPRLLTFAGAVAEIATVTARDIRYVQVTPEAYAAALRDMGVCEEFIWLLDYLFTTVLDGRNAHLTDGVQRALGRAPRDFADYVRATAATGVWNPEAAASLAHSR